MRRNRIAGVVCGLLVGLSGSFAAKADDAYNPYYYVTAPVPRQAVVPGVYAPSAYYAGVSTASQPVVPVAAPSPQPQVTVIEAPPPKIDVGTRNGLEVGLGVSDYHYQEHDVANAQYMRQTGIKGSIVADATTNLPNAFFATADLRFAYSKNNYYDDTLGSSRAAVPDFLGEVRLMAGRDFLVGSDNANVAVYDFAPYAGIGYRMLDNDFNALKNGYRRDSEYFYLPVGVTQRFRVADDARISATAEFDYLLKGKQTSYLTDVSPLYSDTENDQNHGYGLRGNIMYEMRNWAIGPFAEYWNIDQSVIGYNGYEPHNQTLEFGAQVRYRFY